MSIVTNNCPISEKFFQSLYPGYQLQAFYQTDESAGRKKLHLVLTATEDPICPKCLCRSPKVHDTVIRKIREAPMPGATLVELHVPVRRVRWPHCHSRAVEKIPWLEPRARISKRLASTIQSQLRELVTLKSVCTEFQINWRLAKKLDKQQLQNLIDRTGVPRAC